MPLSPPKAATRGGGLPLSIVVALFVGSKKLPICRGSYAELIGVRRVPYRPPVFSLGHPQILAATQCLSGATAGEGKHPLSIQIQQVIKNPGRFTVDTAKQDRAERLFRQQQEAPKALAEYLGKQEATRVLTAKLRAERLAREAVHGKPKLD